MGTSTVERLVKALGCRMPADLSPRGDVSLAVDSTAPGDDPVGLRTKRPLPRAARLTIGWLTTAVELDPLLTQGTFWMPAGLPSGKSVALVSSRLDQHLMELPIVSAAIRTAVNSLPVESFLISGSKTPLHRLVERAAQLFVRKLVSFHPLPRVINERWIRQTLRPRRDWYPVYFYPAGTPTPRELQKAVDSLVLSTADAVRAVYVRGEGRIEAMLLERLAGTTKGSTLVLMNDTLPDAAVKERLLEAGALAWWMQSPQVTEDSLSSGASLCDPQPGRIFALADFEAEEQFLCHWTRTAKVSNSDEQVLDWFLLGDTSRTHGPLKTLCRIVSQRRLRAGGRLISDSRPVVSFSGVRLSQLVKKRRFRPHLARWDFEPFGIAIKTTTMKRLGARQVRYGTAAERSQVSDEDSPFFQMLKKDSSYADWSLEKEWRYLGDLDLRAVGIDEAVAFVPDSASAQVVAPLSRWPVVVLGRPNPHFEAKAGCDEERQAKQNR